MMMITRALMAVVLAATAAAALPDTLYKSTDPNGRVHYSDKPPPDGKVDKTIRVENLPASELPFSYVKQLEKMRADRARYPASDPPVVAHQVLTLYSAAWCGYCRSAKAFLSQRGQPFREIDIDTPQGAAGFATFGGKPSVPLLAAGGRSLRGFTPQGYEVFLASLK